jgi:hypothetical protein
LKFAYRKRLENSGTAAMTLEYAAVTVNPVLSDADFALPR